MDSKVKNMAVFIMFVMIVMIMGIVVYMNMDIVERRFLKEEETQQAESMQSEWQGAQVNRVSGQIGDDLSAFMEDETFFNSQSILTDTGRRGMKTACPFWLQAWNRICVCRL